MNQVLGLYNLSLQRKLVAITMATTLLALILASLAFLAYDASKFRSTMVADLGTLAETLQATTTNAVVYSDTELATQILAGLGMQPDMRWAAVYDGDGELFAEFWNASAPPSQRPESASGDGSLFHDDTLLVYRQLRLGERQVGSLVIRSGLEEAQRRLRDYLIILIVVIFGTSLVALLVSSSLQRAVSEPVLALAQLAQNVSTAKDYSLRANKLGDDEIGRLTSDFNDMLAQIETRDDELRVARDNAEQANKSKSVFLASMSHELRTPLTAIIGYSEILEDDADEMGLDDFLPDLRKIKAAGKHLLGLINSILDLSKVEAGKMELYIEPFELGPLVSDVSTTVLPLVERNGNTLEVDCPSDIAGGVGDLTKIRQVLFNLLSNASKFTERGMIRLSVATAHEFEADWFVFKVADSGIGMTDEQRQKLFKPFAQADASTARNYGGTGLGLALCKRFCELMGGWIDVESTLGEGSSFTVWLPQVVETTLSETETTAAAAKRIATGEWQQVSRRRRGVATQPLLGSRQVLVIDDDPAIHDLLRNLLESQGFDVTVAHNGREGLAKARQLHPHIITLDVQMPEMDGWDVLSALKADDGLCRIPVIMISVSDERTKGYAMGAEYLTKPIDRRQLSDLLEKYRGGAARPACLVVDDDAAQYDIVRKILEEQGWAVRRAENGLVALREVSKSRPDLILLDLIMPQLDGFGFLGQLRKHTAWREIPVAVVTAMDVGAEERERLNGGVERVLKKSALSLEELKREIESLAKMSLGA